MSLTIEEAFAVIAAKRKHLEEKVYEGIKFKLRIMLSKEDVEELVSDAMLQTVSRLSEGKVTFETSEKLIGYILFACWNNYRDANKKSFTKANKYFFETEDSQLTDEISYRFVSLDEVAELEAPEPEDYSQQDKLDKHHAQLYDKLFTFLEDSVANGTFTEQQVSIYRTYIINGYTNIRHLAAYTGYTYDICRNAMKAIRTKIKETDFK